MVRGFNLSPWPTTSLNVTTPQFDPGQINYNGTGVPQGCTEAVKW